jgi:hypothetical protein
LEGFEIGMNLEKESGLFGPKMANSGFSLIPDAVLTAPYL